MSFYNDTAGEYFSGAEYAHSLEYFAAANALILLIDPLTIPEARALIVKGDTYYSDGQSSINVIRNLTEVLRTVHGIRPARLIKTPVAVVLTKFDLLFDALGADHPLLFIPPEVPYYDEAVGVENHEQIGNLLVSLGASEFDAALRLNFADFRYFVVSSLGASPILNNSAVDARGVQPFRVDEPLAWLLSRLKVIDAK